MSLTRVAGSYRDPSGFVYRKDGVLLRQVHSPYAPHYEALRDSGLYEELVRDRLLLPHEEVPAAMAANADAWRVLRPLEVPFISYPFEWCFDQLRDAALLTLDVLVRSLERGLVLKDASAYNIQFLGGRPVLIDTLSFERYVEGRPWIAYRQFCQHFLAPLLLVAHVDRRLASLLRQYLDGVPLDLASRLLPSRTWTRFGPLLHVHLHARSIRRHGGGRAVARMTKRTISRTALLGLADSLRSTVRRLDWSGDATEWAGYEDEHNYTESGFEGKRQIVARWLDAMRPAEVWDLGANAGGFARLAAERGAHVIALDADAGAVTRAYRSLRGHDESRILPLVVDLTNPTPAMGWGHLELQSLFDRGRPDAVLCLALVHHLALTHNLPLPRIADVIARFAPRAIVEFVPKTDPQVRRLLVSREDIFHGYTRDGFEAALGAVFDVEETAALPDSERVLYRLRRRHAPTGAPAREPTP